MILPQFLFYPVQRNRTLSGTIARPWQPCSRNDICNLLKFIERIQVAGKTRSSDLVHRFPVDFQEVLLDGIGQKIHLLLMIINHSQVDGIFFQEGIPDQRKHGPYNHPHTDDLLFGQVQCQAGVAVSPWSR